MPAVRAESGFITLERLRGVFIMEDVNLMQMISGFEMQNNFSIFALDPASKMRIGDMPLFRAHEHSTCFQRQCCGRLREFSMDVQSQTGEQFINIWRPFKCTCACFNRSTIHCRSGASQDLGEIYNPWAPCDRVLEVRAPTTQEDGVGANPLPQIAVDGKMGVWYQIRAACCQTGNFCVGPCGGCAEVVFNIYGPTGEGEPIGEITRRWPGCLKQDLTQASNFTVIFPEGATPYQKATLISAVMLIDFLYFEKRKPNQQNQRM